MNALERKIRRATTRYKTLIPLILAHAEDFARIPVFPDGRDHSQPFWCNGALPGLDAAVLYTLIAQRKPAHYIEIGSGPLHQVCGQSTCRIFPGHANHLY